MLLIKTIQEGKNALELFRKTFMQQIWCEST